MNIGLIGWAIASGNGGMNSDIATLASWITHWLVPQHPNSKNHQEYLDKAQSKKVIECKLTGDNAVYDKFLDEVDGILYVEYPCLKGEYDIVAEAKKKGKLVIGIPMWEWWPERKPWSLQTDVLWAVTQTTHEYLQSLSMLLFMHGYEHAWKGQIFGNRWGVNINDFKYNLRTKANSFVFINGNGGYKLRKASDVVFEAFSRPGAPPLTVYTQKDNIAQIKSSNITLIDNNFPTRSEVYSEGDVFLFTSYWEGLCHGIYEGQASGGLVVTTDHPPMNECGTPFLVPVEKYLQEDLSGKKICKAVPSAAILYSICKKLYKKDIAELSETGRSNIETRFDLRNTLDDLYTSAVHVWNS